MSSQIPLSLANITEEEILAATDALRSQELTLGPWTKQFEDLVSKHTNNTNGIATNSGNSAMEIALESLGIENGHEVLTASFAFPSTASAILHIGATPRFVDCDPRTLNLDAKDVEAKIGESTKAIIATHTFGNPAGIDELARIAQEHEIPLIEDARQAIGSKIGNRQVGTFGRVAVFAFHSAAQLTCVEGGMIVTDDDRLASRCRLLRNHGYHHSPVATLEELHLVRTDEHLHTRGHGYRLSEVHAAVGCIQMKRMNAILEKRAAIAEWYTERLCGVSEIMCPTIQPDVEMSWDGYVVRLGDRFSREERDEVIRGLHRHDIGAADFYQSIPTLPPFQSFNTKDNACPVAQSLGKRTVALPFYTTLTQRDVGIVCQTLELMLTRSTFSDI